MSYTPYNAPVLSGLLGDPEIVALFSVRSELAAMSRFEQALARAEAAAGLIPEAAGAAIAAACETFEPDVAAIGAATAQDGVAVPEFVRQLRAHVGTEHADWVHRGVTSQDVIDTSLVLRLRDCLAVLADRLAQIDVALADLGQRFGTNPLMGRTRMQAALPITAGDRIATWRTPLRNHAGTLDHVKGDLLQLQLGGAVGTRDALGDRHADIAAHTAQALGLGNPQRCWHTDRSAIAELAHWLSLVAGSLGKLGQDLALMAQMDEVAFSTAGGSSAMPHKRNPVRAETLVTLARFNATQLSGLHNALVHEQERSGAAWTLEWMILPQMVVATGAATRLTIALLSDVTRLGDQ